VIKLKVRVFSLY